MGTKYGVQHRDGSWYAGAGNLWVGNAQYAYPFPTWHAAELYGLREIRESSSTWFVRLLPDPLAPLQSPVEA